MHSIAHCFAPSNVLNSHSLLSSVGMRHSSGNRRFSSSVSSHHVENSSSVMYLIRQSKAQTSTRYFGMVFLPLGLPGRNQRPEPKRNILHLSKSSLRLSGTGIVILPPSPIRAGFKLDAM